MHSLVKERGFQDVRPSSNAKPSLYLAGMTGHSRHSSLLLEYYWLQAGKSSYVGSSSRR